MNRISVPILIGLALSFGVAEAKPPMNHGVVRPLKKYKVQGKIADSVDISGGVMVAPGRIMLVGDEGGGLTLVDFEEDRTKIEVVDTFRIDPAGTTELDAEALAFSGRTLYVTGSHGISRVKKVHEPTRYRAVEFTLDGQGVPVHGPDFFSFSEALKKSEFTSPFWRKELQSNGVNVEGLAFDNGKIYMGLRSPSTEGFVTVLVAGKEGELFESHQLKFGKGYGVRAIEPVDEGFLFLLGGAGPDSDASSFPAVVAFWDGVGKDLESLGILQGTRGKPEALIHLGESAGRHRVLIFSDGVKNGAPASFELLPRENGLPRK